MRLTLHRSGGTQPSGHPDVAHALDDALWPTQARGRRINLAPVTTLLSVVLIALFGVWGGAELQKRQGRGATTAAASGPAAGFAGRFGGGSRAGGATGAATAGAATAGATVGTVTVVTGKTLYLTSSSGAIVKVALTPSTTYSRDAKATKAGVEPGDTAIVQGTKSAAGVVATSVSATAKGVTSTGGTFGGFGGTGTGRAAGTTGG